MRIAYEYSRLPLESQILIGGYVSLTPANRRTRLESDRVDDRPAAFRR